MSFLEKQARELSRPTLEAAGRALDALHISPDWVTHLGLLLTMAVAALAGLGEMRWAALVYLFAAACDSLDGALARVSGKGSRFGAFLDSTIDRLEESLIFLGLIIYYARAGGRWQIPVILVASIGSLMVSYTRARAEALGVACAEGWVTRPVRVLIMILGMALNQVAVTVTILAAATLFTTFQRIYYVWRVTGGERGGWAPVDRPFVASSGSADAEGENEAGEDGP